MDKTLAEEFEDLNLIELFQTHKYPDKPEVIKSSKNKDAVLYQGYYYNFLRLNEMDEFISSNPTASFSKQWDKKVIELSLKYSEVAIFCPEFNQVDSSKRWWGDGTFKSAPKHYYHRTTNVCEKYNKKMN